MATTKSRKPKKKETDLVDIDVQEAYSVTEEFINKNQQVITIITVGIALIIGGYFAFNQFYVKPQEARAQVDIFPAQRFFEQDSFRLALNGFGDNLGFLGIIDEYGMTKTGNLANYYAGICYLRMSEFDSAIEYLKDFSSDDDVLGSMALGAIGDAYMELEEEDEGINYYVKAADNNKNEFSAPLFLFKAGLGMEKNGRLNDAKEMYKRIQNDYPESQEGRDIVRYLTRVEEKIQAG